MESGFSVQGYVRTLSLPLDLLLDSYCPAETLIATSQREYLFKLAER
jgi:hypothetical protein